VKTILSLLAAALLATCALPATAATKKPVAKHKASKTKAQIPTPSKAKGPLYAGRPEVIQQAEAIAARRSLDVQWVREAIGQARFMPGIAKAILPPPVGVPKNWAAYSIR
jgi:membrane-bound lytic murein transglycosylase B